MEPSAQIEKKKYWLNVLMWVVGVGITILAGYTSVTFTSGAREQRLVNVEVKIEKLEKEIEFSRSHYVTREELRDRLDWQTRTLEGIQRDVRALRGKTE